MKSVHKALVLLQALGSPKRLQELATISGLPKPTVHRILQVLVSDGFAIEQGDGVYAAGPRVLTVAGEVLSSLDHQGRARPLLRELQERTRATVHFGLLAGDEAIYVDKLESGLPYEMASRIGMRLPLHCTAIGKAILSQLSEAEAGTLLDHVPLERRTAHTLVDRADLRTELDAVRAAGYAIDDEENEAGIRCVAAPVFDHRGRVIGAVSVSSLVYELSREGAQALGPQVARTAAAVSGLFGAPAALEEVAS